jgi:hypothetical protein
LGSYITGFANNHATITHGCSIAVALSNYATRPRGGFWRTDNNFDPVLHLKNILLKQSLDVTPEIYFADGAEYDLPAVHLEPAGVTSIDLRAVIEGDEIPPALKPHISKYEMVGISYQWSWPAVIASIQSTDLSTSLSAASSPLGNKSVVHHSPEAVGPQVIHGSWWRATPYTDDIVAVGNTSLAAKHVEVQVSDSVGNVLVKKQLLLPPHQTSLVRVNDLLSGNVDPGDAGGLTILYAGASHAVVASASIEDTTTGFSFTPQLVEQVAKPGETAHAVTLHAPGLMLGRADTTMGFAPGTIFTPYAVLHNISPDTITGALYLTSEETSGAPVTRPLDTITVAPGATLKIDMSRYFPSSTPLPDGIGHLSVAFNGKNSDLLFDVGSVDQSKNYVFPVVPSIEAPTTSKIFCYWSLEEGTSTMISVWNYADKSQDATLMLYYGSGGQYKIPIHLEPRQTYNLDLMMLVHNRVPDADGKELPEDVGSGSAELVGPKGELDPMTVVVSASTYNVREATCWPVCTNCGGVVAVSVPNYQVSVNRTVQATATVTTGSGIEYMQGGDWTIGNPSIANVSSGGIVGGLAAGSTSLDFTIYAPSGSFQCYYSAEEMCESYFWGGSGSVSVSPIIYNISPSVVTFGSGGVPITISGAGFGTSATVNLPTGVVGSGQSTTPNQITLTLTPQNGIQLGSGGSISVTAVQQKSNLIGETLDGPYSMLVIGDVQFTCIHCQTTKERDVTYQVKNYLNTNAGSVPICEIPVISNWTCNNGSPSPNFAACPGTASTASNGQFTDGWTFGPSGDYLTPTGCGVSVDDRWYWTPSSPTRDMGHLYGAVYTNQVVENGTYPPQTMIGETLPF